MLSIHPYRKAIDANVRKFSLSVDSFEQAKLYFRYEELSIFGDSQYLRDLRSGLVELRSRVGSPTLYCGSNDLT